MKAEVVYQKMLDKANKNFTNGTIELDRSRAVYLFNEEQNKFIEWSLQKRNNFEVLDIQNLLETQPLSQKLLEKNFTTFSLPENYFSFSNVEIYASGGSCSGVKLQPIQVKPENIHELEFDENNEPSIKYRETLYGIENNSVKVFKKNFEIDSVKLKYYRYPVQLDIEGYITEDNTQSTNQDPEFEDRIVDRIISMCVTSFDINNENMNKVQFDINRVNSKF